ncbi:hypothetical protein COV53_05000 [Candidatus Gottesmanbacteria bacterium CG11_big_fil_rev_8_21_14_0_20_37_11]|uniref:Uncharacterized protein n=2 Tax=Candidatus Gottesmaniibacteriota TaxID=1752720 RepID=A0A1J4TMY7_9BACT|nr:MAG: hypothetical protein AUJ73_05185 [Candidatus Gottesmanbacteria bacterium CG1_02_37_22]PIR08064.1 MAG: hypothetical protein COV53_05000 [Candidatus Gottesmanbacteria bacterium CG11_big_fil_rev_8_21_14_0_20_37_11]
MGQILLSYWWIIVLVIIIIAIITRSLFKILILLVVASIFFVLFWQVFISSGFSESSECFTNEAIYMSESYDKYQQISSDEQDLRSELTPKASFTH